MRDFAGQVVWITGASSGIGEALAGAFAERGARLVLCARRERELERVRARCARPAQHLVLPFDITQLDLLPAQVARVLAERGRIDVLINNAGVSQRSLVSETALEVDRRLFETDFFAPVALVNQVLPHMLARRAGQIVAIASVAGLVATPLRSSYSAAKAALIAFHDALRAETHEAGIAISVICPGFVATEIAERALTADGSPSAGRHPLPSYAIPPDEFARRALAAIAAKQALSVIAGRERVLWWLERLSPRIAQRAVRRVRVV